MADQTLAIFLRTKNESYQRAQQSQFYERAHLHRFSPIEYDANNDADIQLRQIQECINLPEAMRPSVLLVNPVRETTLEGMAHEAARGGIGWVSLNRSCDYVTLLRRQYPKSIFLCVDPDQRQAGRLQAQQIRSALPNGGSVFYIHGPLSTSSARLRLMGFETELAGCGVNVIAHGGDWTEESGYQATGAWLRSRPKNMFDGWAFGGQNDAMAIGAYRALTEDLPDAKRLPAHPLPAIVGCDGLVGFGQRFVIEQKLVATVVIPATAGKAVDAVAAAVYGGMPPSSDIAVSVTPFPESNGGDVVGDSTMVRRARKALKPR